MKFKGKFFLLQIICILTLIFCFSSVVSGVEINVNGSHFEDIQSSINEGNSGDLIKLGEKTYYANNNSSQIKIKNKKNMIIQGNSFNHRATLDGKNYSSIFSVSNNSSVTFKNINFLNANYSNNSGAAILAKGKIFVENCCFKNNKGESGAAIALLQNSNYSTIVNCQFIKNKGIYPAHDNFIEGGAVDSHVSHTTIKNCLFEDNYAFTSGGAVCINGGTSQNLINLTFIGNTAPFGGAIRIINSNSYIFNCSFNNNKAFNSGGAIFVKKSKLNIEKSFFLNNNALINGGGIYSLNGTNDSSLYIKSTLFNNNIANYGGGIYSTVVLNILATNFNNNNVIKDGYGGAIYLKNKGVIKDNSRFNNNSANWGSAIFVHDVLDIKSTSFFNNKVKSQRMDLEVINGLVSSSGKANINILMYGGNNALNAIYSFSNVNFNGNLLSKTTKMPNQNIILNFNGKLYTKRTNLAGNALFPLSGFNLKGINNLTATYNESNLCTKISNKTKVKVQQSTSSKPAVQFKTFNFKEYYIINYYSGKLGVRTVKKATIREFTNVTTTTTTTISGTTKKTFNSTFKNINIGNYNIPQNVVPSHMTYCSCGKLSYSQGHRNIFLNKCPFYYQSSHKYKSTSLVWNPKKVTEKEGEWTCTGCGADFCSASGKEKLKYSLVYLLKNNK